MEISPFSFGANAKDTWHLLQNKDILLRFRIFIFVNLISSVYYFILFVSLTVSALYVSAFYLLLDTLLSFILVFWLASLKEISRKVFLVFSLMDFFIVSIFAPMDIFVPLLFIYRIWILGINKKTNRLFMQ